ncbi:MAG: RHS repeat protein [Flavobacterium sp.]|nr:RHS repeat protein [Flavobacterium sp.]
MKLRCYLTLLLLSSINAFSQLSGLPDGKTNELPTVIPPSPTVAGLMKFEEIPVSNYTGVPDINIPIFSIPTHSKDIQVAVSLNYHPASIVADEEASFTGLGWSLFAGGTISRTVRDIPDESLVYGKHMGIHNYDIKNYDNIANPYDFYGLMSMFGEYDNFPYPYDFYQLMPTLGLDEATDGQIKSLSRFLYDTYQNGIYDTQHDLYQFEFMGHSGRFYITKKNGDYQVVKLDNDNSLEIIYDNTTKAFTIYDEKGYRYIFDVLEETESKTMSYVTYINNVQTVPAEGWTPIYKSAFHLSKIIDSNNIVLAEFQYQSNYGTIETRSLGSKTINYFVGTQWGTVSNYMSAMCGHQDMLLPMNSVCVNTIINSTQKLSHILVTDQAKIDFILENDREDTNNEGKSRLKQIVLRNWAGDAIKKVDFVHTYSEIKEKNRMMLSEVHFGNYVNAETESYELSYAPKPYVDGAYPYVDQDYWGYYNKRPSLYDARRFRDTDREMCKTDVLQKMKLPSGGAIVLNFESNTYSYKGDEAIENFDANIENWTSLPVIHVPDFESKPFPTETTNSSPGNRYTIQPANYTRYANFYGTTSSYVDGNQTITGLLYLYDGNTLVSALACPESNPDCSIFLTLEANKEYTVRFEWFNSEVIGTATLDIEYRLKNTPVHEYLFGGGLRVKNIGYFTNGDVPQNYYDSIIPSEYLPAKQKDYDYSFFDNPLRSSGSLVFPLPVYEYPLARHYYIEGGSFSGSPLPIYCEFDYNYRVVSNQNNLQMSKTKGADVGYANVTVSESGNGKSKYKYTSPIDFPEHVPQSYPFAPSLNKDYNRGLLKTEQYFRQNGDTLKSVSHDYEIDEQKVVTGVKVFAPDNCRYDWKYSINNRYVHDLYYGKKWNFEHGISTDGHWLCDEYPYEYIKYGFLYDTFGWSKLTHTLTKDYFYEGSQQRTVTNDENFTYDDDNKKVLTQTSSNSSGDILRMEYQYAALNSNHSSELTKSSYFKNGIPISSSETYFFPESGNLTYLPKGIITAKGIQNPEDRLHFNKYDAFSNLLEVQQEGGTKICYIWGYNKTQPVAKIENIAYSAIPTGLITAIENASLVTGSESAMLSALTNLRNNAALADSMVTTFTYKPLIGVSTVTDPKGNTTYYNYDAFGRLKNVKDKDGNILSENEYHYKP